MTTLRDLVGSLDRLGDDQTLYARPPWSGDSEATAAAEGNDPAEQALAEGQSYLLEVSLAREALEAWRNWRGGRDPSADEAVEAVIYCATNDSYQPP